MKTQQPQTVSGSAHYLKEKLSAAAKSNPRYSLRAFAKKLELSAGGLSQILAGKKNLSPSRAREVAAALQLGPKETEHFLLLVQIDTTKNATLKAELSEKLLELDPQTARPHQLGLDQFRLISNWFGFAILEMVTELKGPWPSSKIAKKLGISKVDTELTLDRLQRLELIEKTGEDTYRRVEDRILVRSAIPSEAIRSYQREVAELAVKSINRQTPKEKVIGTEVFAFDPDQLDEARKLTHDYLNSMLALAERGKNRTEIYQAFTNFFKLEGDKQ